MGGKFSRQKTQRSQMTSWIHGLGSAGKTSLWYSLRNKEITPTVPTIGFHIVKISSDGLDLVNWDVGSRGIPRSSYPFLYTRIDGFIYVVDSADVETIEESLKKLDREILQVVETQKAVVMVLANKQDLPHAVSADHIESKIKEMCTFSTGVSLFVMPCSLTNKEGLQQAFDVFVSLVTIKKEGKLKTGLIPSALEVANQELANHEVANKETDDATTEGGKSSSTIHRMKNSLLKDPFNHLKSVLFY